MDGGYFIPVLLSWFPSIDWGDTLTPPRVDRYRARELSFIYRVPDSMHVFATIKSFIEIREMCWLMASKCVIKRMFWTSSFVWRNSNNNVVIVQHVGVYYSFSTLIPHCGCYYNKHTYILYVKCIYPPSVIYLSILTIYRSEWHILDIVRMVINHD